jgi:hypothetical protein
VSAHEGLLAVLCVEAAKRSAAEDRPVTIQEVRP